uniref:SNF2 N-terminal domain-containing protein n=1 Tax=Rhizophora mucronata TaxID=61149 RepID=A0A2P2M0R0_RHIMU
MKKHVKHMNLPAYTCMFCWQTELCFQFQKAQYAILLSGTPALSRPIELFKQVILSVILESIQTSSVWSYCNDYPLQLEALYPAVYKNVHEYGNRYCRGGVFGVYQGASNHEELHILMKATIMIRRLKRDVLSELPLKRRQQVGITCLMNG